MWEHLRIKYVTSLSPLLWFSDHSSVIALVLIPVDCSINLTTVLTQDCDYTSSPPSSLPLTSCTDTNWNVCVFTRTDLSALSPTEAVIHLQSLLVLYKLPKCKLLSVSWCIRWKWLRFICYESLKQIGSIKYKGNETVISKRPFSVLDCVRVCKRACVGADHETQGSAGPQCVWLIVNQQALASLIEL